MKRQRFLILFVLVFLLTAPSCSKKKNEIVKPIVKETIKMSGASTGAVVVQELIDAYKLKNPQLSFKSIPGLHSSGGAKGVASGLLDMGIVAQLIPEIEALDLKYYPIAKDPIMIAVNSGVKGIVDITSGQLKDIYSGKITNWNQLGGPNEEIIVLDRKEGKSAKVYLRKNIFGPDLKISQRAAVFDYESDLAKALSNTSYSIGYLSSGYKNKYKLKPLALDGTEASLENVKLGKYNFVREVGIVVGKNPKKSVMEFLKFSKNEKGKKVLLYKGYLPL